MRQIEREKDRGVFVSRAEAEATTLSEVLERYRREITPRKRGAAIEQFRLDRWARHPLARRFLATIRGLGILSGLT
ncbi:MAG: hypothetical protein ACYCTF_01125 [Acidiferrobacter sp.]